MSDVQPVGEGCQLLVPFPAARYVQILMQVEERLFTQPGPIQSSWGVCKKECGHFSTFVTIGAATRTFKPCFFTQAQANKFTDECGEAFQGLTEARGARTARLSWN